MAAEGSPLSYVRSTETVFELEALEGLPCGCVLAAYRAKPWDVAVISVEAKGVYCIYPHVQGGILRIGDPADEFDEDEDEEDE